MLYPSSFRSGRNNANFTSFDVLSAFDDLFTTDTPSRTHRSYNTTPRANVVKTDTGYGIELAAPGFSRDEFELSVHKNKLTIGLGTEDTIVSIVTLHLLDLLPYRKIRM